MKKYITKLTVYLHHQTPQKLGTLAIKNKKIYFEYDKEFLETGVEISPYKLPLKPGVHRCDDSPYDGLWGVFADSLPDGWGRLLMDRHLAKRGIDIHALTPLDRLAYVGSRGMGALGYVPAHETTETLLEKIVLDDLAAHSGEILKGDSRYIEEFLTLSGSSTGARPKILAGLSSDKKQIVPNQEHLPDGFTHWIVKFAASSDNPEAGAVEYAYSLMAKAAGLNVPESALLEGQKGRYFAVKRFDRDGNRRVHMHSVAGLTHSDFRFPTLDYDDLLGLTLHLTKSFHEVEKMFRLAVFNLFTHNRDDHAKNFSFLMDEKGAWWLSPVYDLTYSSGPGGEHSTMYLGEGKKPTIEHLAKLGKKHMIKKSTQIIDEVHKAVSKWRRFAEEAGVNRETTRHLEKIFREF